MCDPEGGFGGDGPAHPLAEVVGFDDCEDFFDGADEMGFAVVELFAHEAAEGVSVCERFDDVVVGGLFARFGDASRNLFG